MANKGKTNNSPTKIMIDLKNSSPTTSRKEDSKRFGNEVVSEESLPDSSVSSLNNVQDNDHEASSDDRVLLDFDEVPPAWKPTTRRPSC